MLVQLVFWVLWLIVGGHPGSTLMVLLAILAFAMGIQTPTVVALGVHAVFTTAVTATWTALVGDAAHWSATRTERRRLTLVLGGTFSEPSSERCCSTTCGCGCHYCRHYYAVA